MRLRKRFPWLLVPVFGAMLTLGAEPGWGAGDTQAGESKSKTCRTCHGRDGVGTMPQFPNLAGQKSLYLSLQLEAFRSGARVSQIMNVVAKSLSDEDIADLAAYYESLPPGGEAP